MLIRFVIEKLDPDSGRRQGLFQAAKFLRESGQLSERDHQQLDEIREWFNTNLERPVRLSLSPRPHAKKQALSWFKDTAATHVGKMREYGEILERYDVHVLMVKTNRPGYVVYEDEYQVCAYPFTETQT